jgi:hypothetical protein
MKTMMGDTKSNAIAKIKSLALGGSSLSINLPLFSVFEYSVILS